MKFNSIFKKKSKRKIRTAGRSERMDINGEE